jgi:hypothetical protein
VAVVGDGKLGLLIAQVLSRESGLVLTHFGRHTEKLALPQGTHERVVVDDSTAEAFAQARSPTGFPVLTFPVGFPTFPVGLPCPHLSRWFPHLSCWFPHLSCWFPHLFVYLSTTLCSAPPPLPLHHLGLECKKRTGQVSHLSLPFHNSPYSPVPSCPSTVWGWKGRRELAGSPTFPTFPQLSVLVLPPRLSTIWGWNGRRELVRRLVTSTAFVKPGQTVMDLGETAPTSSPLRGSLSCSPQTHKHIASSP